MEVAPYLGLNLIMLRLTPSQWGECIVCVHITRSFSSKNVLYNIVRCNLHVMCMVNSLAALALYR